MRWLMNSKWLLFFLLITTCVLITNARRGGGGSRGGGSRGSSSRGSSSSRGRGNSGSSSTSSRGSTYDSRSRSESRAPAPKAPPPPPPPPAPKPQPKPSAPEVVRQPAQNPNFKESNPSQGSSHNQQPAYNPNYKEPSPGVNQQPPPYSPRERPPPYNPSGTGPQGPPPPYNANAGSGAVRPGEAPPPYSPYGSVPGANYPRQPGMPGANYPQQGGVPGANYPRQPGANYPQQSGVPGANYPRQPGGSYPQQGANHPYSNANYPQQGGIPGANYPRQPGGIPGANYPRQTYYPPNSLGSNVWQPQSGMPSPPYMNYGGLPTGSNMYSKPIKQKGFLGSLMSMGSHKSKPNKYFGSQPSPYAYGAGGMGGFGGMGRGGGGFMGKHGSNAAMYTILPYMIAKRTPKFRPRIGFMPMFLPSPFHHHHYHYGHGYYGHTHYDVYNNDYVGRCNKPLAPDHGKVMCNSTRSQVDCDIKCDEGYLYPDNTTTKGNKCWHVTGVWKPIKNFPACQPVCNKTTCLNGGTCIAPDVCGCPPEYRGPNCEFYFLNCDIRKMANGIKIRWVCTHSKNETTCKVKCKSPYEFDSATEGIYKCTPDGVWSPSSLPQCVSPEDLAANATKSANATEAPVTTTESTTSELTTQESKRK